jgi:mannose-6-phosphate isomerase-like protein (cupin superfamily)
VSGVPAEPVDLDAPKGRGPVWGLASEELNATLLSWGPGEGVCEHVNAERDVLLVVLAGSGLVTVDGHQHMLGVHDALLIRKQARQEIRAGGEGLRYLSVHRRRGPLQILPLKHGAR